MCGLENSDTCEILLDTDGEFRFMSLELREETKAQDSEKGDIRVGWEASGSSRGLHGPWRMVKIWKEQEELGRLWKERQTEWLSWDQGSEGGFTEDRGVGQAVETWKVRENLTNLHWLSTGVERECRCGQWGTKQHKVSGATLASPTYSPSPSHFTHCLFPTSPSSSISSFWFVFFILICLLSLPICLLHPFLWWFLSCPLHVILIPTCPIMNAKNQESKKLFWPMMTGRKGFLEHQSLTDNWLCVNSLRPDKFSQAPELALVCHLIISYNHQK